MNALPSRVGTAGGSIDDEPVDASADPRGPWRQFICRACGYIYDEAEGDPDGGLAPGTRYEDIPDDWACPLCGVSKQDFDPYAGPGRGPRGGTNRSRATVDLPMASRGRKGVVIVGGGLAGWSVARALRCRDPDIPITLVAGDTADVYPKPALSLAFGHGKTAADLVASFGADVADDLSVRLVPRAFTIAIDTARKRIRTTRGTIRYDALVLAVGAKPVEIPQLPPDLCWRINALETWTKLHAILARGPCRVAVVGAGLVGCELADDLAHAGHCVTVLDPAARPLAAWASIDESRRLLDGWRTLGVRFIGSVSIVDVARSDVDPGRRPIAIRCADGTRQEADVVIAAIGLTIDTRLARTAGLAIDTGIAVDATTFATSVESIHAAGDCVSIDGRPCRFIEPIARQAAAIADCILGKGNEGTPFRVPLVRLKARSAPMTLGSEQSRNRAR